MAKPVLFTDLDGTLLDVETYSPGPAAQEVRRLVEAQVPIVFCSAKTRAEQEAIRHELAIPDPFIVENGGAIFVPDGYFADMPPDALQTEGYLVIEIGIPYLAIRDRLRQAARQAGIEVRGYGDMGLEEVAELIGLDPEAAARAKKREYDESFVITSAGHEEEERLRRHAAELGLNIFHGGRMLDAMGPNDKGKAVKILVGLFERNWGPIQSIGIGDSPNDIPMLQVVETPVLVQRPDGMWAEVMVDGLQRIEGVGPIGWQRAVKTLLEV